MDVVANAISIQQTGVSVTVPNNPCARLMYYLNTINGLVNLTDACPDLKRYVYNKYKNDYFLNRDEKLKLFALCDTIKPELLNNKLIFNIPELCGDNSNEYYKITDSRARMLATEDFVIMGKRVQVLEIMTYKDIWLKRNYYNPLVELAE